MVVLAAMNECSRCGSGNKIEKHHIIYRSKGGKGKRKNKTPLCQGCHDYRHEKEELERQIERELKDNHITEASRNSRLVVLRRRLEIVEVENTPDKIRERGYKTYFALYPNPLPRRIVKKMQATKLQGIFRL